MGPGGGQRKTREGLQGKNAGFPFFLSIDIWEPTC